MAEQREKNTLQQTTVMRYVAVQREFSIFMGLSIANKTSDNMHAQRIMRTDTNKQKHKHKRKYIHEVADSVEYSYAIT